MRKYRAVRIFGLVCFATSICLHNSINIDISAVNLKDINVVAFAILLFLGVGLSIYYND